MSNEEGPAEYVRVVVALERDPDLEGPDDEWLWAEPLGSERYRIESSPFFAYGVSHGDLVVATGGGEMPRVVAIERKSGHRTLRVALDGTWDVDRAEVQRVLDGLLDLGCTYEAMPPKLVALDLPPEADDARVIERLQQHVREEMLIWEWADPRPS